MTRAPSLPSVKKRRELACSLIEQMIARHQCVMHCSRSNHTNVGTRLVPTTMEGIVLKKGIGRWGARLPRGMRKLEDKLCFTHATNLATSDGRYIYCEGYAAKVDLGMAILHAWVLDAWEGYRVVDPTWENPVLGCYIGIPFSTDFLRKTILRKRSYGIIDDWKAGFPIFSLPPSEYLHELAGEIPHTFQVPTEFDDFGPWGEVEKLGLTS